MPRGSLSRRQARAILDPLRRATVNSRLVAPGGPLLPSPNARRGLPSRCFRRSFEPAFDAARAFSPRAGRPSRDRERSDRHRSRSSPACRRRARPQQSERQMQPKQARAENRLITKESADRGTGIGGSGLQRCREISLDRQRCRQPGVLASRLPGGRARKSRVDYKNVACSRPPNNDVSEGAQTGAGSVELPMR